MAQNASLVDYEEAEAWDLVDDEAGEGASTSEELQREWRSRHTHFHTLGYRDGIEEGKKMSVQQGFDEGYTQAVEVGRSCGLARGWAGALTALPSSVQSQLLDDIAKTQLDEVNAALSGISSDKAAMLYLAKMQQDFEDSESRNDSFKTMEMLHKKLQSILQSRKIIS